MAKFKIGATVENDLVCDPGINLFLTAWQDMPDAFAGKNGWCVEVVAGFVYITDPGGTTYRLSLDGEPKRFPRNMSQERAAEFVHTLIKAANELADEVDAIEDEPPLPIFDITGTVRETEDDIKISFCVDKAENVPSMFTDSAGTALFTMDDFYLLTPKGGGMIALPKDGSDVTWTSGQSFQGAVDVVMRIIQDCAKLCAEMGCNVVDEPQKEQDRVTEEASDTAFAPGDPIIYTNCYGAVPAVVIEVNRNQRSPLDKLRVATYKVLRADGSTVTLDPERVTSLYDFSDDVAKAFEMSEKLKQKIDPPVKKLDETPTEEDKRLNGYKYLSLCWQSTLHCRR